MFTLEWWKSIFEIGGIVLLVLTAAFGAGALYTNKKISKIQAGEILSLQERLIRGEVEFQKAQQQTANAETRAAEAQLALRKYIDDIASHTGQRILDSKGFIQALKGRAKAPLMLLYVRNNSEAYNFAIQIRGALESEQDGAGWNVSGPFPVPSDLNASVYPELANAPDAMKLGASSSLDIFTTEHLGRHNVLWEDPSPAGVLAWAFLQAGSPPLVTFGASWVPEGTVAIIVGQKP